MRCRRQYPGGWEGLVVPGGKSFGLCDLPPTKFFGLSDGTVYAVCDAHVHDVVGIPRSKLPALHLAADEAEVFFVMVS